MTELEEVQDITGHSQPCIPDCRLCRKALAVVQRAERLKLCCEMLESMRQDCARRLEECACQHAETEAKLKKYE